MCERWRGGKVGFWGEEYSTMASKPDLVRRTADLVRRTADLVRRTADLIFPSHFSD